MGHHLPAIRAHHEKGVKIDAHRKTAFQANFVQDKVHVHIFMRRKGGRKKNLFFYNKDEEKMFFVFLSFKIVYHAMKERVRGIGKYITIASLISLSLSLSSSSGRAAGRVDFIVAP